MAAFNAALSEVQSRVRSPDAVVTLVEARILPELLRERSASNNFISEFQKQLAAVEWKDQHGRMPRWRELEPSRKRLAQAIARQDYLSEREAGWRLRVEALRDGGSEKFAEANRRDAAAASHLTAAFRGSE